MASNVYTKNEILQKLASKGYFIDAYTLDTFFQKWKIESIFEDEQGSEFYDKNALDIVLNNLFSAKNTQDVSAQNMQVRELRPVSPQMQPQMPPPMPNQMQPMPQIQPQYGYQQQYMNMPPPMPNQMQPMPQIQPQYGYQQQMPQNVQPKPKKINLDDPQTIDILNNISLSDGTPLINKVKDAPSFSELNDISLNKDDIASYSNTPKKPKEQKLGILEGAMQLAGQEFNPEDANLNQTGSEGSDMDADFDDMSLLSESLEAQEKFKEYVISELQKKNADFNPNNLPNSNEFKLDISERTIAMIARTMAKKIAKNINQIFTNEAKNLPEIETIKEENKKLEKRTKDLEEQNRKLRLLLSENKKYLNSFQPTIFGLYKKVNPEDVK